MNEPTGEEAPTRPAGFPATATLPLPPPRDAAARTELPDRPDPSGRLTYLLLFRLGLITLLFGMIFTLGLVMDRPTNLVTTHSQLLFGLIILAYANSLVAVIGLRRPAGGERYFAAQLAGDILLVSALVHLTGGPRSVYTFLYPMLVVEGAIAFSRRGTAATTATTITAFLGVTLLGWQGLLPIPAGQSTEPGNLSTEGFITYAGTNVGAQVAIGVLASFLNEQLRRASAHVARQEVAIAELTHRAAEILESLASGVITLGPDGTIRSANAAACRLLGARSDQLLGTELRGVLPPSFPLDPGAEEASRRRTYLVRSGHEAVPVEITTSPFRDGQGKREGLVLSVEDLSALADMERRVERAEQLAVVGRLSAGIAHEIRNPLASVSGALELLGQSADLAEEDRRLLAIALREVDRLSALLSSFLAYARPRPPQREPIDLADLCAEVAAVCRQDPLFGSVIFALDRPDHGCPLEADPGQLRQVVWNLFRNAAEAMPTGGTLTVRLEERSVTRGREVRLRVSDTGEGIPAGSLATIFEPFFTTKDQGTGLGLATVHQIVEQHGGGITVESTPGQGSTFVVRLPPARDGLRRPDLPSAGREPPPGQK
jgi:two-component system sensor histidine kinase PilS (NtrC family)